jgi:hypothetical protein
MYASDTMEIKPTAFELMPTTAMTTTPYALHVYELVITNNGGSQDIFTMTHASSSFDKNGARAAWTITYPVTIPVDAGLTATLPVSVLVPFDAPNWVTNTATITATSDNSGGQVSSELTTWTGGYFDGTSYVRCRYDFDASGIIALADVLEVSDRFGDPAPLYDFDFSGLIAVADVLEVADRFGDSCPAP